MEIIEKNAQLVCAIDNDDEGEVENCLNSGANSNTIISSSIVST